MFIRFCVVQSIFDCFPLYQCCYSCSFTSLWHLSALPGRNLNHVWDAGWSPNDQSQNKPATVTGNWRTVHSDTKKPLCATRNIHEEDRRGTVDLREGTESLLWAGPVSLLLLLQTNPNAQCNPVRDDRNEECEVGAEWPLSFLLFTSCHLANIW